MPLVAQKNVSSVTIYVDNTSIALTFLPHNFQWETQYNPHPLGDLHTLHTNLLCLSTFQTIMVLSAEPEAALLPSVVMTTVFTSAV